MIRFYAYYNHGGYKDFYVGNQEENVTSKYFLPLLGAYESTLKREPENEDLKKLIDHQRQLPKLVTLSDTTIEYNYPKEARMLMSHGGYKVLYKRLNSEYYALAIRDVAATKDVYGRQAPFNMMFVGDSTDLDNMDLLANYVRTNFDSFSELLSSMFVNDIKENGLRCDIESLTSVVRSVLETKESSHDIINLSIPVRLLVVSSPYSLQTTLKEQNLNKRDIFICYDQAGNKLFCSNAAQPISDNDTINTATEEKRIHLSLHSITKTPKIEDIDKLWDYIREMELTNVRMSKHIDELEKRIIELENNRQ